MDDEKTKSAMDSPDRWVVMVVVTTEEVASNMLRRARAFPHVPTGTIAHSVDFFKDDRDRLCQIGYEFFFKAWGTLKKVGKVR